MPDRQADSRSLNFAGDIDEQGRPRSMSVEVLRARTEKWPQSPHTTIRDTLPATLYTSSSGVMGAAVANVEEGQGRPAGGVLEPVAGCAHRAARVQLP